MRIGDPTGYLIGGCGCGLPWYERENCAECTARQAAWIALSKMAEVISPECLNGTLPDGSSGWAGRQIPPHKVAIFKRAIELAAEALDRAKVEHPSGPIGVVPS